MKLVDVPAHATKLSSTTTLQHHEKGGEMVTSNIVTAAIGLSIAVLLWLYRINQAMKVVPKQAAQLAPRRWTTKEIQETYERMKKNPSDFGKHLPPSLDRRYIVFGGAGKSHTDTSDPFSSLRVSLTTILLGMVGGDIVLQLLQRGQSPESIRIVDFQPVSRPDVKEQSRGVSFVKADMTSPSSVEAAFSTPWPESVAKKPLTVFHTAAMIDPSARSERLYGHIRRVNVDGTANVLGAAKAAGADIFVATSSASISFIPADLWIWPWQSMPEKWFHKSTEADFDAPLRPHDQFFSNCKSTAVFGVEIQPQIHNPFPPTTLTDPSKTPNPKPKPNVSSAAPTNKVSGPAPSGPGTASTGKRPTPFSAHCSQWAAAGPGSFP